MILFIALKDEIFSMLYHLEQKSQEFRLNHPFAQKPPDEGGLKLPG